jgi:cell wall-associated NlpC family hydrolase
VDCGQLIAAVFHEAGLIDNAEIASYPPDWMCHRDEERFRAEVERFAETVERAPVAGDIVLFRWGRSLAHGAIVVGWPLIIHAQIGRGVILSSIAAEAELRKRLSSTTWTLKGWA